MNGVFDGSSGGGGRNIMPKGMGFVLESKIPKRYRKSAKCKDSNHGQCGGLRNIGHGGYVKCECPCHTLEMDPNL